MEELKRILREDTFAFLLCMVLGLCLVVAFGWLGFDALVDYRTFGDRPLRTDVAGAVRASATGRQWVSVDGAPWQCVRELRNVEGGHPFLTARSDEGAFVVARFDREIDCAATSVAPVEGVIEPMAPDRRAALKAAGLTLSDGANRTLDVCTNCGRDNARLGVIMCGAIVLIGFGLYPIRRELDKLRRRWGPGFLEAISSSQADDAVAMRAIRLRGLFIFVVGAACAIFGEHWEIEGAPLRPTGIFLAVVGALLLLFAKQYRALVNRKRR